MNQNTTRVQAVIEQTAILIHSLMYVIVSIVKARSGGLV